MRVSCVVAHNLFMNKQFIIALVALPSFLASLAGGPQGVLAAQASTGNSALNVPSSADASLNWAGYDATGGTFTAVGASWDIPQSVAQVSLSADATWVGIGGITSRDLIQAGTQTVFQNGTTSYEAWYELLPSTSIQVPLVVHPGDAMTISISEGSNNEWQISFADATTGQNYATSVSYQSSLSSAEWVEEMPSDQRGFVSLDNFGSVSFTNAYAVEDGNRVTIGGSGGSPMTMINGAGQALTTPSSLGADGASFTIARTSVLSTSPTSIGRRTGHWSRGGVGVQGFTPMPQTSSFWRGFGNALQSRLSGLGTQLRSIHNSAVRGAAPARQHSSKGVK